MWLILPTGREQCRSAALQKTKRRSGIAGLQRRSKKTG
jgi:hypothetical protein